jgi:hypothetical protein
MKLIRKAQILFITNALIWLGFGVYAIIRQPHTYFGQPLMVWIFGILLFGNATAILLSAYLLGKRNKWSYYFAFVLLVANILAGLMDQLGIWDIAYLLFEAALLIILISIRKFYGAVSA